MGKVNVAKLLGIAGAIIGLVGTLISDLGSSKQIKDDVAEEVEKQLAERS